MNLYYESAMEKNAVHAGLEAGAYVALLGFIAWVSGRPFIFPSLGPTALALTLYPQSNPARGVLGGHLCGIIAGLLAYHIFASGLVVTDSHTWFSAGSFWLTVSGAVSVFLTVVSMMMTRTVHAPSCATTLIISLGLLPNVGDGIIIMTAVIALYGAHKAYRWIALQ